MSDETHLERVRRLLDEWASTGRAEGVELGDSPVARLAYETLAVGPGQRYLDIGCGNGHSVRWAAQIDPTVEAYGLDMAEEMAARARHLSRALENARFIHAPFPLAVLKARAFDAIFSKDTFYFLPDLIWGLVSVVRLLKPGGRFACIVDYYTENPHSHDWPTDFDVPMVLLAEAEWAVVMAQAGLEVVEQRRLITPLAAGETPTWKNTVGSLFILAQRPAVAE